MDEGVVCVSSYDSRPTCVHYYVNIVFKSARREQHKCMHEQLECLCGLLNANIYI